MRILKLMHKPTQVYITKLARKNCVEKYGDEWGSLMLESVKHIVPQDVEPPKRTFMQKIVDKIRNSKELTVHISSNDKRDFFVNSNLRIGSYNFTSKKQPFDFAQTLYTLKDFKKTVQQTKDDILQQLTDFNKLRRQFDRKFLRND